MSCSICRLPFVPCALAATPLKAHYPPAGIMSNREYSYFERAACYAKQILPGPLGKFQYFSANMFGQLDTPIVHTILWSCSSGTFQFQMMHTACANILRKKLDCETEDLPSCVKLCELEVVLGRGMRGADEGRLEDVCYESVGDRIDLNPFWRAGNSEDENVFDYTALKDAGLDWLLARPDTFPRFFDHIKPERQLAYSMDTAPERTDLLTTMPMDILHVLLEHLPPKSYVQLMATCRFLRHHALTTFQPYAQRMVCKLGWAIASKIEMDTLSPTMQSQMARINDGPSEGEGDSSTHGDWFLYLSHIHRTRSMRARRWIWSLVDEVVRVYEEKRPGSIFGDDYSTGVRDPAERRKKMRDWQKEVRQVFQVTQMMARREREI
ncbi:hypothetical protein OF83DRAFT_1059782 [Amylostereum chailletii]|nr:hypothetical protein OF83DRAFT_1059782 [Amylostereum chailletii]